MNTFVQVWTNKDSCCAAIHSALSSAQACLADITERGDVRWVGGVKPEIYKLAASFATIQVQLLDLLHGELLLQSASLSNTLNGSF